MLALRYGYYSDRGLGFFPSFLLMGADQGTAARRLQWCLSLVRTPWLLGPPRNGLALFVTRILAGAVFSGLRAKATIIRGHARAVARAVTVLFFSFCRRP